MEIVRMHGRGPDAAAGPREAYKILESHEFRAGQIELREYSWRQDREDVWETTAYFLDMRLSPSAGSTWATYLDASRQLKAKIGQLMFVPPARPLRSRRIVGRQRSFSCALQPEFVEELLERSPTWSEGALWEGLDLSSPLVESYLLQMYRELRRPGFASDVVVEALACALAVALIRTFRLDTAEPARRTGGLGPARMRLIRERLHSDQPYPSVQELADLCGVSVRHLSRGFKEETGLTIAQFVKRAVMEQARILLSDSSLTVREIAERLGFSGSSSFGHAFVRETGILPRDYRRGE
jgi:AraC family transcriptional regulator